MSDRPVLRCVVAWWPDKRHDPFVRPKALDRWVEGKRTVSYATMTLEEAASYASMGYEVIVDPFDHEDLTRWDQLNRGK